MFKVMKTVICRGYVNQVTGTRHYISMLRGKGQFFGVDQRKLGERLWKKTAEHVD